jgi:hypothetical protein
MATEHAPSSPQLDVPPVVAESLAVVGIAGGYPDGGYPSPRRMGQFDKLQLGSFAVVPADQLATKTYFGLRHTDTFLDVLLTDSSGKFYLVSNSVRDAPDGSLAATPWLGAYQSTPDGLMPDVRYTPWSGAVTQTLSADDRIRYALSDAANAEEFSFGVNDIEWKTANGDVHVTGVLAGNGTQWRLPWREPEGDTGEMFYNQQGYRVDGVYFSEPVTGHIVVETMWGNEDYVETWWVPNRIGHWAFFVNNYADGTSEFGQVLCGEYGARGVIVVDEHGREVVNTTTVNAYAEPDGNVRYEFGAGEAWEFTTLPERGMPAFGTTTLAIGSVRRVDDPRELVRANAVGLIADRMGAPQPLEGSR